MCQGMVGDHVTDIRFKPYEWQKDVSIGCRKRDDDGAGRCVYECTPAYYRLKHIPAVGVDETKRVFYTDILAGGIRAYAKGMFATGLWDTYKQDGCVYPVLKNELYVWWVENSGGGIDISMRFADPMKGQVTLFHLEYPQLDNFRASPANSINFFSLGVSDAADEAARICGRGVYGVMSGVLNGKRKSEDIEQRIGYTYRAASKVCGLCGIEGKDLSACSGCMNVWYCDQNCRKMSWKYGHKAICNKELAVMVKVDVS